MDADVPQAPSCGVYISQLVRFARVCSDVSDSMNEVYTSVKSFQSRIPVSEIT